MNLRPFLAGIPYVGWVVVYTAFCWGMFGAILGVVSPELRQDLGNYQDMGLLMAVWAAGSLVGAFQGGRLAHQFEPRRLFLVYIGLTALALGLLVLSSTFWLIAAGFFFVAVFEAALFTLGHSVLANVYSDPQLRGRSLGLVDVAYSSGHLVAPSLIMGLQLWGDGWRLPYEAFFVLVFGAALAFWRKQPFEKAQHLFQFHAHADADPSLAAERIEHNRYGYLLAQSPVRWAMFSGIMAAILEWGPIFWTVSYAMQVQGMSATQARIGLQFFVAGMVAVRIWQSFWHSRWSLQDKLWRLAQLTCFGTVLVMGATYAMPSSLKPWGYWLVNLIYGMGIGVFFPVLLAWLIDRYELAASKISALQVISFTLGCQIAGILIGALSDHVGLQWAYAVLVLLSLGLLVGIRQLRRF